MKPAMKALIGLIVVGAAAYGGSYGLDVMAARKAAQPPETVVAQQPQPVDVQQSQAQQPAPMQMQHPLQQEVPQENAPAPRERQDAAIDAGLSALLQSGVK